MSTQPTALRLADALEISNNHGLRREAAAELRRLHAENEALKQTLHDELDGNLRLRELGGALPTEPMTTFLERVFAENEALRADAERYRWLKDHCALGIKQNGAGWSLNTRQCVAPDSMRDVDAAIDAAKERT